MTIDRLPHLDATTPGAGIVPVGAVPSGASLGSLAPPAAPPSHPTGLPGMAPGRGPRRRVARRRPIDKAVRWPAPVPVSDQLAAPAQADGIGSTGAPITIDDIPDAVFATDLTNTITSWSDQAAALFGYTAEEAIGRSFGDLLPFEMRDTAGEAKLIETIAAGGTWRGEGTVRLRDGRVIWLESVVKARVVDGRVLGSVSISRDVTAGVESERLLAAEQRFVDAVLDVQASLVIVLDRAGNIVRFNSACERMSGYMAAEVEGKPVWDLLPADEAAASRAAIAHLAPDQFPNTSESRWLRRDGTTRVLSWFSTCLVDEHDEVSHVITTGIDVTDERRGDDALHGIETVGRLLADQGPTAAALDAVLAELERRMDYRFLSIYVREDDGLRIGAQRGYESVPERLDARTGVIGRVFRTGRETLVPDVRSDPDFVRANESVVGEIAVPLCAGDEILGVLNIESATAGVLTQRDLRLANAIAERLASALVLNRDQIALRERARLFAALAQFAGVANAILDPDRLAEALGDAVGEVIAVDTIVITTLDRSDGQYRIRAVRGVAPDAIGSIVSPGDGNTGRAITERTMVASDGHARAHYASVLRDRVAFDVISGVAVPLIREGVVLGVISVGRAGGHRSFTDAEREGLVLLGTQAALALANAHLHAEVSELAIHDGLTGLFNRRHFDATLDLMVARCERDRDRRASLAAIMFDLDHFGRFNKEHGHQAGDTVLRAFATILRDRLRSSDLVARYGGEEFVAIVEDCRLSDAVALAESVRSTLERQVVTGPLGEHLRARVSAGCAVLNPAEPTKESLLRAADVALFMAKRGGRNQVVAA